MKTAVLGGRGLFGTRVAEGLAEYGRHTVSLRPDKRSPHLPSTDTVTYGSVDVLNGPFEELVEAFAGCDSLVSSLGVPTTSPLSGAEYARTRLVGVTERVLKAAVDAGVERVVLLGTYLTAWHRTNPGFGLASRHPYVEARLVEAESAVEMGQRYGVSVCVLEVPYVFGTGAGERQNWREILFDGLRQPVTLFPTGGTSVITSQQLADAVVGAVERGEHGARYPLSDLDLTWRELISHALEAMERRAPIMGVPVPVAQMVAGGVVRRLQKQGQLGGLSADHIVEDILARHIYVDATESRRVLRYRPGGVPHAIRDTARAAYGLAPEPRREVPAPVRARRARV